MAFTQAITYNSIALPAAYCRVVLPQIELSKTSMTIRVWVFPDEAQAHTPDAPLLDDLTTTYMGVPFDMAGANPLAQAYAYLKTLPAYAGATDA